MRFVRRGVVGAMLSSSDDDDDDDDAEEEEAEEEAYSSGRALYAVLREVGDRMLAIVAAAGAVVMLRESLGRRRECECGLAMWVGGWARSMLLACLVAGEGRDIRVVYIAMSEIKFVKQQVGIRPAKRFDNSSNSSNSTSGECDVVV